MGIGSKKVKARASFPLEAPKIYRLWSSQSNQGNWAPAMPNVLFLPWSLERFSPDLSPRKDRASDLFCTDVNFLVMLMVGRVSVCAHEGWVKDYSKTLLEDAGCFPSPLPHSLASVPCVSMGLLPGGSPRRLHPPILSHLQHALRPRSEVTSVPTLVLSQP